MLVVVVVFRYWSYGSSTSTLTVFVVSGCPLPSSHYPLPCREMARGRTRGHKGGRKQFSNPDQIKDDMAKEEEKRLWREQHPDSDSESSEEEEQTRAKVIAIEGWGTSFIIF